ncbi:MAG TPA: hypothetical protein VG328_00440 [Stellaceae bacterium]|jgi:hypothetical protein|nr:hypothetical protein [Stellaceae bacterium]
MGTGNGPPWEEASMRSPRIAIHHFVEIFDRGAEHDAICRIVRKYLPIVHADCSGMAMAAIRPDGHVNVESLERYQADCVKWGMMRRAADIRSKVDMSFVDDAAGKLGKYQK